MSLTFFAEVGKVVPVQAKKPYLKVEL